MEAKFKHPRGLYTLFFTELWERLSYYGMRAILILFMVETLDKGGLGFEEKKAGAIYGLYTAGVYLFPLPGGWLADRLLGLQGAIWFGGIIIALGHFTMALPAVFPALSTASFFVGLILIVMGTGLLKPSISANVGILYPQGGAQRDAGYTIYYMGINIGAFIGPLICGYLGEKVDWHLGFGFAGIGMVVGLIQFHLTRGHLGAAGLHPSHPMDRVGRMKTLVFLAAGIAILGIIIILGLQGILPLHPTDLARYTSRGILAIAALFFLKVWLDPELDKVEKQRVVVIFAMFIGAAMFWSGFEQAGSSLNLFADRYTDREVFGGVIPASWFQSLNPLYIILLAPFFAAFWVRLARKNLEPSLPMKFTWGLLQLALGFLVMFFASKLVLDGNKVLPTWLLLTYLVHTTGELCLSPVGLSSVNKLAPPKYLSQMMGVWFLGSALGNLIAGLVAGEFGEENMDQMPARFMNIVLFATVIAVGFAIFSKPLKKMMGDAK